MKPTWPKFSEMTKEGKKRVEKEKKKKWYQKVVNAIFDQEQEVVVVSGDYGGFSSVNNPEKSGAMKQA